MVDQDNLGNVTTDPNAGNQRLYAGKYKSEAELESGYLHQMGETQRIIAERNDLQRKSQILEALVRNGDNRTMPADRVAARSTSAVDALAEQLNVDANTLHSALGEVAAQQLQPVTAVMAARQRVGVDFPDFGQFEPEVNQFLNANPEVDEEYRAAVSNPVTAAMAMRYARLMYDRSRANAPASTATATTDASGAAQANARLDAMIPGGGGGGRAAALVAQSELDLQALLNTARNTPRGSAQWDAYLYAALGDLSQGH